MTRFIFMAACAALALGLASCAHPVEVATGDLPPIAPDYRTRIVAWADGFYVAPRRLREVGITDPVLTRDGTGRLLWLVCIEADAPDRDGRYLGAERQAFGFAPNWMSAPLDRRGATLTRQDCDARPLRWRRWDVFHEPERHRPERHGSRSRRFTNGRS